jgi:transcriptional regulator with XRE-family HTH domain
MEPGERVERLAEAVRSRRYRLGMSQQAVADAASVSLRSIGNLERGEGVPQLGKRLAIETALRWAPGSIEAVMRGEDPTELSLETRQPQPVGLGLDAEADGLPLEDVEAIRAQVRALKRARGLD